MSAPPGDPGYRRRRNATGAIRFDLRKPDRERVSPDKSVSFSDTNVWIVEEIGILLDGSEVADSELASWIAGIRADPGASCADTGVQALRAGAENRARSRPAGPPLPFVKDLVTDQGTPVRLYRPVLDPRPLVLFLHGGGFVFGDLNSHDEICRRLSLRADAAVLAVDYKRAPEHPGPAAVQDAVAAVSWASKHLPELGSSDDYGIGLAGDSAGAAIALLAAVQLAAVQPVAGQPVGGSLTASALLLAYPNTDMTLSRPSITEKGRGWGLDETDLAWFIEQWVPVQTRRDDPSISPLHASLEGLPATMLITAEHDPLRDEGEALVAALKASRVRVQHRRETGLVHGFLGLSHISPAADRSADQLFTEFGGYLRQAISGQYTT
ncbi:MAG: acetyl esterase [Actinomycetota bacterium]|nr:acetyl esterase [Actinomycetota bacterium]